MCGIIGLVKLAKNGKPMGSLLYGGLKKLEYRGYDSCGIGVLGQDGAISVLKDVGKVDEVAQKLDFDEVEGSCGIAHCLYADTFVQLSNGEVRKIKGLKAQGVLSISSDTLKFSEKSSMCGAHDAPEELLEVSTPSFSLRCTAEHRLFVFEGGQICQKRAGLLRKGDLLVCAGGVKVQGSVQPLKGMFPRRYYLVSEGAKAQMRRKMHERGLSIAAFARLTGIDYSVISHILKGDRNIRQDFLDRFSLELDLDRNLFVPVDSIHGKFISLPSETSKELMQFLGYLLGDGTVNEREIRFKDADPAVLASYNELAKRLFNVSGRVVKLPEANAYLLEINSLGICEWVRLNFPELTWRRRDKTIPSMVGRTTTEEVNAFLRGLFDAEGCVSLGSNQVKIAMNNDDVIRIAQLFLTRSGIIASYSARPKQRWGLCSALLISNREALQRFAEGIGFGSYSKNSKLRELLPKLGAKSFNTHKIPFTWKELRQFAPRKKRFGANHLIDNASIRELVSSVNGHCSLMLQKYAESDLVFQRISRITAVESDNPFVYDLEVADTPNFIANGILSHNSRWATHGGVTRENAHPHPDCTGRVALVHNGIVENFQELRSALEAKGHSFRSQTDTEALSHLVEEELKPGGPTLDALRRALLQVEGSYAIALLNSSDGPVIYAARKYCPLAVASSPGAMVVASDPAAIVPYSNEMAFLNDGEIAVVSGKDIHLFDLQSGKQLKLQTQQISWSAQDAGKDGYEHYMLKEIREQPVAIGKAIGQKDADINAFAGELLNARRVMIAACGTARHAGLVTRYAISRLTGRYFDSMIASEYAYFADGADEGTVLLAISQSGETADLLECVRKVKARGGKVLSIVNAPGSTLARESGRVLYINAGPEIAVASTKAFLCQSALGILLAYAMAGRLEEGRKSLSALSSLVEKTIGLTEEKCGELSKRLAASRHAYCIARGINYAIAIEGALKIKEVSYVHAEGMPAGELKHGTLALIEEGTPVIAINPCDYTHGETLNNAIETKARGAYLICISDIGNAAYDFHLPIPTPQNDLFYPLLSVIPMQLLAYCAGVRKGLDVDKPRNLAKSVTVK